jgi:hypothetical protein
MFAADFAKSSPKMLNRLVNAYMIGEGVCVIMDTRVGVISGHAVQIYVPDASADLWKIRMTFVSF